MKPTFYNGSSFPDWRQEKEIAILTLFLLALAVFKAASNFGFDLTEIDRLYISQATLEGVAVDRRIQLFYRSVIFVLLASPLLYSSLCVLRRKVGLRPQHLTVPAFLAAGGTLLIAAECSGFAAGHAIDLFAGLLGVSLLANAFTARRWLPRIIAQPGYSAAVATLALLMYAAGTLLFNSAEWWAAWCTWMAVGIYLFLMAILPLAHAWSRIAYRRLFFLLLPLAAVPPALFVSVESVFWVHQHYGVFPPYRWIFAGSLLLVALAVIRRFGQRPAPSTAQLFRAYFLPGALLAFLLLALYEPVIDQPTESFELANPANALMRIFAFGEIPFLDFLSSHVFSEQYYGILHNLIFGYEGNLDFLTYKFFNPLLVLLLAYVFLTRLLGNGFLGLVFLLLFPFTELLVANMLMASVLVLFIALRAVREGKLWQYYLLLLLPVVLFFWKLDTGSAALFAAVFFVPVLFWAERQRPDVRKVGKAFGLFLATGMLAVLIACLLRPPAQIWDNLVNALHYAAANQAHGYAQLAPRMSHVFARFHIWMPAVALILIFHQIVQLRREPEERFARLSALFFFLVFLGNFQRGLVRHGFMEGLDTLLSSTFYLALALSLFAWIRPKDALWRFTCWASISFVLVIGLKHFPVGNEPTIMEKVLSAPTLSGFDRALQDEGFTGKVTEDEAFAAIQYQGLKELLDRHLSPEQTFLDFSNTPMLYYYCQRRVPAYFCQNLQNTVDDHLQIDHLSYLSPEKVPVVVYAYSPRKWWDATDGVPNAMRQYLIAEYIYAHYKPFGRIGQHSIWIAKDWGLEWPTEGPGEPSYLQHFDYNKAAGFVQDYFAEEGAGQLELLAEHAFPSDTQIMTLPEKVSKAGYVLAECTFEPAAEGKIIVQAWGRNDLLGVITFRAQAGRKKYMVPLSNHYLWHAGGPERVLVKGTDSTVRIKFYKYTWDES